MARLYTCVLFNRRFDFAVSWPCQTSCGCRTAREQWRTHARTAAAPEPVAEPGKPVFSCANGRAQKKNGRLRV